MIIEVLVVCLIAKVRHLKLKYLFYTWTFYPILLLQCILVMFQFSIFFDTYYFVQFVPLVEPTMILSFIFAMFAFKLYKPAMTGSLSIVIGTILNKFVIAQNGGKMPVYPTLSYLTGYVKPEIFDGVDSLHILGSSATRFAFLTDYIDFGYSILSPGDVLIHLFSCIMLYFLIKAVNTRCSGLLNKDY